MVFLLKCHRFAGDVFKLRLKLVAQMALAHFGILVFGFILIRCLSRIPSSSFWLDEVAVTVDGELIADQSDVVT